MKEYLAYIYVFSIAYCLYRLYKRYEKSSLDGVIGVTPGLDVLAVMALAPILMVADVTVNMYRGIKKYYNGRK